MIKALGFSEIERILGVTDELGLSREAVVIPLRPEHPGRMRQTAGKLEIVVEREADFDEWLAGLERRIRELMDLEEDDD